MPGADIVVEGPTARKRRQTGHVNGSQAEGGRNPGSEAKTRIRSEQGGIPPEGAKQLGIAAEATPTESRGREGESRTNYLGRQEATADRSPESRRAGGEAPGEGAEDRRATAATRVVSLQDGGVEAAGGKRQEPPGRSQPVQASHFRPQQRKTADERKRAEELRTSRHHETAARKGKPIICRIAREAELLRSYCRC